MDEVGGRSAIFAQIQLPAALEAIRKDHVSNARLGVPAHVTLLFPFVPAAEIHPALVARATEVIARQPAFEVEFTEVRSFPPGPTAPEGVAWLAPNPAEPFLALTRALVAAFPLHLPYGGLHSDLIPHLTLADVDVDAAAIEAAARAPLPFSDYVAEAALFIEDRAGRWQPSERFPLA